VAKVGSERITVGEMATIMESRGGQFPAKFLLNPLISQRIMRIEAKRLGFAASDLEVAQYIRENFKPEEGKPFDQARYEQYAVRQAGSITAFEQSIRDSISAEKLEAFLTSGVTVAEEEVISDYQRKNTKFDLTYVPVVASDLAQTITPTDEELKAYFEKNKTTYYISTPQKKIRYIFLNTAKVGEKMSISDEDLKAEWANVPEDKKIKGVEGQEIVLRVPRPEDEGRILERANEIIERLKKNGTPVSAETFAEVAKGFSENPGTASSGGKIPALVREDLNKAEDPYQRLIKMSPGEITEPISYQGRLFILRRGETAPKSFEDAKKELEVSLRNRRAYTVAAELAQKITDDLKQTKNIDTTAQKFAAQANMSVKDMIRETGFVKTGDDVPNIGISAQFEQGIATLENANDIGEKIPIKEGFAIPMLLEKRDPRDAEFDEVKDKVTEAVKIEKARAQVEEIAKQISAAGSANDLANAAKAKNLSSKEQKTFILGSPLGEGASASTNPQLEDAIFALKVGEVTKTPIKVGDNWYVIGVTKREEANMEEFAKQRDTLLEAKLQEKRGQVFQDYLASIRQQMEAKKEIVVYQDAMAKLESNSSTPQFPFDLNQ
jgi:peptidyl-prolyl cis-trans isomerase D